MSRLLTETRAASYSKAWSCHRRCAGRGASGAAAHPARAMRLPPTHSALSNMNKPAPREHSAPRPRGPASGPAPWKTRAVPALTNVYAPLGKILDRAGMEGNRRSGGLLVFQLEILRLLVHGDQVFALVEDGLYDVIGGPTVQVLVRNENVPHGGLLVVRVHAPVGRLGDDVLDVERAVLLVHRGNGVGGVDYSVLFCS